MDPDKKWDDEEEKWSDEPQEGDTWEDDEPPKKEAT